jgi:hypothetical protein
MSNLNKNNIMKISILYISLIFFFTIGCKKNELKKPTDVTFKMDINRNVSQQGNLVFTEGNILIQDFSIEGERKEGESVSFSKSFPQGLSINFSPTTNISELVFDIPQGDYYSLVIAFSTKYNNGNSSISVKGAYTNTSGVIFPLLYEFKDDDVISIVGEDDEGDATIILDKDVPVNTLVQFDPVYWFATVSNSLFDSATLVDVNGTQTILVNSSTNEDIYDLVVDRMEETALALW